MPTLPVNMPTIQICATINSYSNEVFPIIVIVYHSLLFIYVETYDVSPWCTTWLHQMLLCEYHNEAGVAGAARAVPPSLCCYLGPGSSGVS